MSLATATEVMLYCPKCQSTYPVGSRRFCDKDGVRLSAAPNAPTPNSVPKQPGGVFTNLLGRTVPTNQTDEKLAATPKFVPFVPKPKNEISFPETSDQPDFLELDVPKTKPEPPIESAPPKTDVPIGKPFTRIIKPSEIASGTAEVGNRKTNPTGRTALTWEKPDVLVGESIKGRYQIIKLLSKDAESLYFLADDKIAPGKKVFVRVFMDESDADDFSGQIFAEERISLSHINHPNIAKVVDSGEILEGNSFIVSEYVEGKTVREMLNRTGQFNILRTARIIRQASYALSEAHQNGVLHRNLKPENIFLDINEAGAEQVKLTNFGVVSDKITDENLAYKSPEQIDGRLANFASDIYSLAVIAFQMLTSRLPFNASTAATLKKAQQEGLTIMPTNLRLDVPPLVDDILKKALAANPTERYPKARDFGDAFFNALTTVAPWEGEEKVEVKAEEKKDDKNFVVLNPITLPTKFEEKPKEETAPVVLEEIEAEKPEVQEAEIEEEESLPWEKRSPETVRESSPMWLMLGILALGLLILGGIWYYLLNRPATQEYVQTPAQNTSNTNIPEETNPVIPTPPPVNAEMNEIPPIARQVEQPANTNYFENSKQGLSGDLEKKFLGFSIYYPNTWTKNSSKDDFLDITKKSADGLPVKQVIITRYESKGLFSQDKANFPKLVEKSNKDLKAALPNFKVVGEGETTIQEGRWKAYEVKFENSGTIAKNGELTLYGRRLWIPIQRPGMKSGFVITLVATSLAPNIQNAENLVSDEELRQILETFEPTSSY